MIVLRLANFGIKRILRHKGLKCALVVLPAAVALARLLFARSTSLLVAAKLCPVACAALIAAILYMQWSVDRVSGLLTGIHASPVSQRALVLSRVLSGLCILTAQMAIFAAILAIRFQG